MPAPYSYDLRRKTVEAINRGHKKVNVSRLFKISRNTLDIWLKREKETGDFQTLTNKQGRHSKIEYEEKFKSFVKENQDKTQTKMAELSGNNITQQNISYTCQKLGITRKKNLRIRGKK
ncbi:MAG: IS630 transposase-related protein [Microcoleaceae cyanobacterium MO_207.B10]|nr:IS630 transposase-related protein [Microcoleaceae cyanobacterium MO_207.B10]